MRMIYNTAVIFYHNDKSSYKVVTEEEAKELVETGKWSYKATKAIKKQEEKKEITKKELEIYAREKHGVELDRRKSLANLIKQVKELDNGNG